MALPLLWKSIILLSLQLFLGFATPISQFLDISLDDHTLDSDVAIHETSLLDDSFTHESHCDSRAQHFLSSSSSIVARTDTSLAGNGESVELAQSTKSRIWILVPPSCPEDSFALCCIPAFLGRKENYSVHPVNVPIPITAVF